MTQSGQGGYGYPYEGEPWGPPPPADPPAGHVLGPGYEGPGQPHGYGYPPLPDAATQYIPSVPAGPGAPPPEAATQYIPPVPPGPGTPHAEAATQYIPPVPPGPGTPHAEAATQYIPPVPAGPGAPLPEAATQYIPPVPAGPGTPHAEAATQYIPPVPPGPGAPGAPLAEAATQYIQPVPGDEQGHTQHLPPIQEPVLRQPPPQPPQQRQQRRQPQPQPRVQPPAQPQQYAYAQPPFEQEDPPRRVSGGIIAAGVIGLAVAGLGVGALLSEPGKAQNNDPAAVSSVPTPSGSTGAAAAEAPVDPARSQAVQLDKLLADSNDSRSAVIRAVEDIKVCKNLDQAATDLRDAARQRDGLVTRLQDVKIDQLPDNARLTAALTKAWKSSAAADRSYAAWAEEVGDDRGDDRRDDRDDKKGCKDGKARPTGNAAAGNKASGEASQAKESAATMWNRIAVKYELTKRDKSQL